MFCHFFFPEKEAYFKFQNKQLRLRLNLKKGMLEDPKGMFRDVSSIGTFGVEDYEAVVKEETDPDYLITPNHNPIFSISTTFKAFKQKTEI
jgi:predicted transport protein